MVVLRQEALAAVLVEGLGRIEVIERDIGDNASFVAGGKKLVIKATPSGVNPSPVPLGKIRLKRWRHECR